MRGGDDLDLAQLLRDQRLLHRPHHAHRDVGLAAQQVGQLVRGDQLDLDRRDGRRCRRASTAGSSHAAATWLVVTRTMPRVAERAVARPRATASGAVLHAPRGVDDGERRAGRRDAAAGALEQRRAELRFELGDVAAERRLLRAAALARRR